LIHTLAESSVDGILQPANCNLPIGLLADATYDSEILQLMPGQRILIPTDGVTEAEDPSGSGFGDGPFQSLVAAGSTLGQIFEQIGAFTAGVPLQDDCTMVEVRYRTAK
jgi:sigma-B regulation protein RsbU (phosphoserine phosphatase)